MTRTPAPSRRPAVLLLARELGIGGSERQLCEMAKSIDRQRFDVHVGCFRSGGIRADEIRQFGLPLVEFPLRSLRSPANVFDTVRSLRRYVRRHDVRIVHPFDPPSSVLVGLASPFLSPAAVLTSQRSFRHRVSGALRGGLRMADRLADGIVVNCRAVRDHLVRDERVPPAHIHLCHNGLDGRRFARTLPAGPPLSRGPGLVVGVVSALRPEKNLSVLIDAFAECQRQHPTLTLAIVGDGPEKPGLQRHAERLGVAPRAVFAPTVSDVVPWLSAIDIFVLPSVSEALSNALMEAMACGCACIASRVGGNPELVEHGASGLLFESRQVADLAASLKRLVEEPDLRRQLARRGAQRIREQFSLDAAALRLAGIYDTMLIAGTSR